MFHLIYILCFLHCLTVSLAQSCPQGKVRSVGRCVGADWPAMEAKYQGRIEVDNLLEPIFDQSLGSVDNILRGGPDERWLHLHRGQQTASQSTLRVQWLDCASNRKADPDTLLRKFELRYVIGEDDTPVTEWLQFPFHGSINVDDARFDGWFPKDGIFHLSFELRGGALSERLDFAPFAAFVHIRRPGFETTTRTPIGIYEPDHSGCQDCCSDFGPNVAYFDLKNRNKDGFPLKEELEPFTDFVTQNKNGELHVEKMNPHSPLFQPINFVWADPAHSDLPFVRPLPPKFAESHNLQYWRNNTAGRYFPSTLRQLERHQSFPTMDGPRGVGWMSGYVQGVYDQSGRFAFVETAGRLAFLYPDGSIKTIAGHVTDPNKDPVWIRKPAKTVQANQVLRGTWLDGQYPGEKGGFRMPMDVTFDPKNSDILYVAGFEDHCIWQVKIIDLSCDKVEVSVFAGDPNHSRGEADGVGHEARFDTPVSLTFDDKCDCLYVSDQFRGRIRKITRDRTVTTLFGQNNRKAEKIEFPWRPPALANEANWHIQTQVHTHRPGLKVTAASNPDLFVPHTIRTTSKGNLVVLSLGFGVIREINVDTGATVIRGRVSQRMQKYGFGWAWMDVDRWGNSGGLDSIYWTKFTGQIWGNQHGGEHWGDPLCSKLGGGIKGITCNDKKRCLDACTSYAQGTPKWQCDEPCATDMFAEIYGFIPPNNDDEKSHLVFTTDKGQLPTEGAARMINPPHYGWLMAVDPRGAVLIGGIGTHGLIRLRKKRADDREGWDASQSENSDQFITYWQGREIFRRNHPNGLYSNRANKNSVGVVGLAGVFGYDARNLLGLPGKRNAWACAGLTDDELLDRFYVSEQVRADATAKRCVLFFLRHWTGTTTDTPITPSATPRLPGVCGVPTPAPPATSSPGTTMNGNTPPVVKPMMCGNGVVEGSEECDDALLPCCDMTTCKFKPAGTECRAKNGVCDVADTCSGADPACRDKVAPEGQECTPNDGASFGDASADCVPTSTCNGNAKDCIRASVAASLDQACDDKRPCTTDDKCNIYGRCSGMPSACSCDVNGDYLKACDDGDPCTLEKCVDGKCLSSQVAVGTACDDNDDCTLQDQCTAAGQCRGVRVACADNCSGHGVCQCSTAGDNVLEPKCLCDVGFGGAACAEEQQTCKDKQLFCNCDDSGACESDLKCAVVGEEKICLKELSQTTTTAANGLRASIMMLMMLLMMMMMICNF